MAASPDIFAKLRLRPGQLRSVAERRFADAKCLLDSGDVERTNGAMYMAGFVIECLLKALLLERHPNLAVRVDPARLSTSDREVFEMLYSHDLDDMLGFLPEIKPKLDGVRIANSRSAWNAFQSICAEWTIYARYSTKLARMDQAKDYLETVNEVKKWLKEL